MVHIKIIPVLKSAILLNCCILVSKVSLLIWKKRLLSFLLFFFTCNHITSMKKIYKFHENVRKMINILSLIVKKNIILRFYNLEVGQYISSNSNWTLQNFLICTLFLEFYMEINLISVYFILNSNQK